MIEHITPDRIANAILQDKSYKGIYVLVEGKKDLKLYSKFFNSKNTRLRVTFGCSKLKEVFEILDQRGFNEKIGILDKDFLDIYGGVPELQNIFHTDFHDIEVMMFKSKALESVIRIYSTDEQLSDFETKVNKPIREVVFTLSDNLGYLKLAEKKHNLGLIFKPEKPDGNQIGYNDFISNNLEYLGDNKLIKSIVNYSRNKSTKQLIEADILKKLQLEKTVKYESIHLSNGHDISNILFILFKKTLRSNNRMLNDFNCIEDSLILAYEFEDFKKTNLFEELSSWQKENTVEILRQN